MILFQIRRMAAILFQAASGQLGLGFIKKMLDGVEKEWPKGLKMAPPNGLYLAKFEYESEKLIESSENLADLPISLSDIKREPIQWDKVQPILNGMFGSKILKKNSNLVISDEEEFTENSEESLESTEKPVEEFRIYTGTKYSSDVT